MAIKIVISDHVKFKVKGSIKDDTGYDQPFDFWLTCQRLDMDQLAARRPAGAEVVFADFMASVITDWSGVTDEQGQPLPYTEAHWRELCRIPGIARLADETYTHEIVAKLKN